MFRGIQLKRTALDSLFKLGIGLFFVLIFGLATVQSSSTSASLAVSPTRSVMPTASRTYSPTPSRTPAAVNQVRAPLAPRLMPGQPVVDANTVALYHFDSLSDTAAIDATGNYTGTFNNGASIATNGQYAGGLAIDRAQSSYVSLGHLGTLPQGTIEMFIDFANACRQTAEHFTLISSGTGFTGAQNMWVGVDTGLIFKMLVNGNWQLVDSGINPCRYLVGGNLSAYWYGLTPYPSNTWPYETWRMHHVAITWGARGMEIWVDGVLHGVGAGITPEANTNAYRCNPQMQLVSPYYPVCATPALSHPAQYAYQGGLPAYSTMLVGCDTPGNCFNGIIDEMRVSNIQRTFNTSIIPTLTPTPTSTSVSPSGEYTIDSVTGALYHLNSFTVQGLRKTYEEVSQTYVPLAGNATIGSGGRFGNALLIDGYASPDGWASYLDIGRPPLHANGAIETWIKLNTVPALGAIVNGGGTYKSGSNGTRIQLGVYQVGGNPVLRFGLWTPAQGDWVWTQYPVTTNFLTTSWHHVVGTWGTRGVELWVDGILRATYPYYGYPMNIDDIIIGCDQVGNCVNGMVDEIRVSNVQRAFAPAITPTPSVTPIPIPGSYYIPLVER